jgi:CubicO group peptidase (beta-lactamase class C family)
VRLCASIVGVALAITGCGESARPPVAPAPPPGPAVDTTSLDAWFQARFPADQPGIAVLIAKRDRVVFARGYGLADLATREPITTTTLFNLGSLSKTFVASAILILQERGALSVDDPLSTYFPAFKRPELAARIRLRHLLTHTSGLPDNRPVEAERDFYLTARDAENWYPVTQADALEFEPGTRYAYSNPAYNALALVIEQVSGRAWQDFVRDEIFLPAHMGTSTVTDGPHPERGVAHAYVRGDGASEWFEADYGEVPTFAAAGNGGVWSSVDELARYEAALTAGRFLRPATVADARTVKTFSSWASDEPPMLGWSWFVADVDGVRQVGHTGSQGGFQTQYFVVPDRGVLVVFLTNTPVDYQGVTSELRRWLAERQWLDGHAQGGSVGDVTSAPMR